LRVSSSTSGLNFSLLLVGAHQFDGGDEHRIPGDIDDLLVVQVAQAQIVVVSHDVTAAETHGDVAASRAAPVDADH
jgi:hypothetical protein